MQYEHDYLLFDLSKLTYLYSVDFPMPVLLVISAIEYFRFRENGNVKAGT